ncbi:MAG: rane-bound metal-dependent hydrolase [Verrucomicrobiales bacterium]|nr:rane-bound metal-dependent hydrolase [Verrucomicrobiales bacterium]
MSPLTHLFASWLIATKTTNNPRDCRLVTLAGIVPDLDGFGLIVDLVTQFTQARPTTFYSQYHHVLCHGLFAAIVSAVLFGIFARQRWRVALLVFAIFHLHLLCDLIGSRGPELDDLWPIFYLGPFRKDPMWIWHGQWPLDGWMNRMVFGVLFAAVIWQALYHGRSVVGVFNQRADLAVVRILRGWREKVFGRTP